MFTTRLKSLLIGSVSGSVMVAGAFAAQAASYTIDPSHSFIEFTTGHLGIAKLKGRFNKFSGTMNYDPAAGPGAQSVKITIDTSSVDTNFADRDKHLRSDDFLKTDSMSTATFESTGYEGDAEGGTLKGNLTFLGTTKEIEIPVTKVGEGKDPWGGYRAGFTGTYAMTTKDFGMEYKLGPSTEVVEVTLMIEAIKDK